MSEETCYDANENAFTHILVNVPIEHWDLWLKICFDAGIYLTEDDEVDTFEDFKNLMGTAEEQIDTLRYIAERENEILAEPVTTISQGVAYRNTPGCKDELDSLINILSGHNKEKTIFTWELSESTLM